MEPEADPSQPSKVVMAADAISLRMIALLERHDKGFHSRYDSLGDADIRGVLRQYPRNCVLSQEDSALVLQNLLGRLEDRIAKLAGTESRQFWLQITGRIPPKSVFGTRPETVFLYRTVLKLAILKYGLPSGRDFLVVPNSMELIRWALRAFDDEPPPSQNGEGEILMPSRLTWVDALHAYQLEKLSYLHYITTAQLRRVWKGGTVTVRDGLIEAVRGSEEAEWLMRLYDQRHLEYGVLLSGFGSAAAVNPRQLADKDGAPALVAPILNFQQLHVSERFLAAEDPKDWPDDLFDDASDFLPNYIPIVIGLAQVQSVYAIFRDELRSIWNVDPDEFLAFLLAVTEVAAASWMREPGLRFSWLQRGYTLTPSLEQLEEYCNGPFQEFMRRYFGRSVEAFRFIEIARVFTYDEKAFRDISLWDRSGFRLLLAQQGLLIDLAAVPLLLQDFISTLGLKRGSTGRAKGENFEGEVKSQVQVEGVTEWAFRQTVHFRNHFPKSKGKREVDWAIVAGRTLVVVECKASAMSPRLDRSEPEAIARRQAQLEKALHQVDTLCQALAAEPVGVDFEVPPEVNAVLAVACSPFPEYISKREERYFLTDTIPRVCVPAELKEFLEAFDAARHRGASWLYMVHR